MLFALFFAGYSAGRFFISFIRQEQNTYLFNLNEAQLVALIIMLVTVPLLIYRARLVQPAQPADRATRRRSGGRSRALARISRRALRMETSRA